MGEEEPKAPAVLALDVVAVGETRKHRGGLGFASAVRGTVRHGPRCAVGVGLRRAVQCTFNVVPVHAHTEQMMANPLLAQILMGVLGSAMAKRRNPGPFGRYGGTAGGGLGGKLGGGLGGAALGGVLARAGKGRGMLLALMLPLAMRWVQQNGGIGAVLERFRHKGQSRAANTWQAVGDNEPIDADIVREVVGREDVSRFAQELGVPEDEVAAGFAEILPEMADKLTPEGQVPPEADEALEGGRDELEKVLRDVRPEVQLR